jgi:hypothetical protein
MVSDVELYDLNDLDCDLPNVCTHRNAGDYRLFARRCQG